MAGVGEKLYLRADADGQMGTGHVMRCFALAQAWKKKGGQAIFVTARCSDNLLERFEKAKIPVEKLKDEKTDLPKIVAKSGAFVLDSPVLSADYRKKARSLSKTFVSIDDLADQSAYFADIVVNPNISAPKLKYHAESGCQFLLGLPYVLLREEFISQKKIPLPKRGEVQEILLTLGGGDTQATALKLIGILEQIPFAAKVNVILGGESSVNHEIKDTIQADARFQLIFDTTDMAALMRRVDLCISGGGTTLGELAHLGVPTAVVTMAANQIPSVIEFAHRGAIKSFGWHADLDNAQVTSEIAKLIESPKSRQELSEASMNLVDGKGCERVIDCIEKQGKGENHGGKV